MFNHKALAKVFRGKFLVALAQSGFALPAKKNQSPGHLTRRCRSANIDRKPEAEDFTGLNQEGLRKPSHMTVATTTAAPSSCMGAMA